MSYQEDYCNIMKVTDRKTVFSAQFCWISYNLWLNKSICCSSDYYSAMPGNYGSVVPRCNMERAALFFPFSSTRPSLRTLASLCFFPPYSYFFVLRLKTHYTDSLGLLDFFPRCLGLLLFPVGTEKSKSFAF